MIKPKRAHKLRENKGSKLYNRLIFFDTETRFEKVENAEHHFLKLGVACEHYLDKKQKETWFHFRTVDEFWNFIINGFKQDSTTVVFAHNMHFDFNIVEGLKRLPQLDYEIIFPVLESGIFIVLAVNKETRHRLLFLDTFNYFKTSVERLGELLDIPKLEIDFETCTDFELKIYCKQDVEIIKAVILKWMEFIYHHEFGNMQYTAASQSFTAFRHKFMDEEIFIHNNQEAITLEQESYRGGRTEAFHIGDLENIVVVDINSLYPFVMKHCLFPRKFLGIKENLSSLDIQHLINRGLLLVAQCEIETYETAIGIKHEIGRSRKLIFPIGKFSATLTNPELLFLLQTGGKIHKVGKVAIYEGAPIFSSFVTELYQLRLNYKEQGNFPFQDMVKLLLNSLYGKFGQQQRLLRKVGVAPKDLVSYEHCVDAETGKRFTQIIFGGFVWVNEITKHESFNSFTAIASYVTAYARIYLHLLMEIPNEVYYCDTDSIMLSQDELAKFGYLLGKGLGQLKEEYTGKQCRVIGAKDYAIDEIIKRKGIKLDAIEIQPNVFQQLQFYKTKSLIKSEMIDRVVVETIEKKCKRIYDKGTVQEDGTVQPLVLE